MFNCCQRVVKFSNRDPPGHQITTDIEKFLDCSGGSDVGITAETGAFEDEADPHLTTIALSLKKDSIAAIGTEAFAEDTIEVDVMDRGETREVQQIPQDMCGHQFTKGV